MKVGIMPAPLDLDLVAAELTHLVQLAPTSIKPEIEVLGIRSRSIGFADCILAHDKGLGWAFWGPKRLRNGRKSKTFYFSQSLAYVAEKRNRESAAAEYLLKQWWKGLIDEVLAVNP